MRCPPVRGGGGPPPTGVQTDVARTRKRRQLTTAAEANHECHLCGKLFGRSYNHKAHMETHDPSRVYAHPCGVQACGKKFVRKTDLTRHYQSVSIPRVSQKHIAVFVACDVLILDRVSGTREAEELPLRTVRQHVCEKGHSEKVSPGPSRLVLRLLRFS